MDVRPEEDIWDPRVDCIFLNKILKYLCICSIYSQNCLSPMWGRGRKRKAISGQVCITPASTTEVSWASEVSAATQLPSVTPRT